MTSNFQVNTGDHRGDNASIDDIPEQSVSHAGTNLSRRKHSDLVHAEIELLQRRFRQIEAQRKQSVVQLANAKNQQLSRLKEINSQAWDDLRLETGKAHSLTKYSMERRIGTLQDEAELYHTKIARESHRLSVLERRIEQQRSALIEQKKLAVQARHSKASVYYMEKRLLVDESKLDSALVKFSEAISQNKMMRESIDDLRRERATFDTLVQRNERELEETKKDLAVMMDQTTRIFQEKGQIANDLAQIKDEAMTELIKLEDEWHALVRILIDDAQQLEAAMQEDTARAREKRYDKSMDQMAKEATCEHNVRQQLTAIEARLHDHRNQITDAMLQVQVADESLSQITRATGIATIQEVADAFLKTENANFYLFQQLSEINAQIESDDNEIDDLLQQLVSGSGNNDDSHADLQAVSDDVHASVKNAEARLRQYEEEIKHSDDCMQVMKRSVERLLETLIGQKETVHNGNIGICLDRIESSANHYVNLYLMSKNRSEADRVRLANVPAINTVKIDPPSVTFTGADEETDLVGALSNFRREASVGDDPALRRILSIDRSGSLKKGNDAAVEMLGPLFRRNRTTIS